MTRPVAALLLVILGCKGEGDKKAAAPPPAPGRDAAPVKTGTPAEVVADKGAPNQADRKDAEALLADWVVAQGGGDFAGYQAFYGDGFTGVRRSGKKVRRFDRAGWMADRGRMFEKPMSVTVDAVHVMAHGAQTHLFFTQTFEQGTYKDSGRKWIALERAADGRFRIVREEMLDSTLIAQQAKELATAKGDPQAKALGAGEVQLGWAGKRDKLYLAPIEGGDLVIGRVGGAIGTGPVTVAEHTTDAASGAIGGVTASRAVDATRLPPALARRLGKNVQLLDGDLAPLCHARISGYSLKVVDWAPEKAADSAEEAAAALLDEAPLVVAELQMSGCPKGAAFARDVDLPALPEVTGVDPDEERRMVKAVVAATEEEGPEFGIIPIAGDTSRGVASVSAHTENTCETQEEYRIALFLLTRKGKAWEASPLSSYNYEDSLTLAADVDGDGTIDVFTARGSHRGADSDFWTHDLRVFWPPGLGCDGCEGDECGD